MLTQRAWSLWEQGELEKAVVLAEAARAMDEPGAEELVRRLEREVAERDCRRGLEAFGQGRLEEALSLLEKAGTGGSAAALFNLGVLYERGEGVAQDKELALSWYEQAAARGHEEAQFRAGTLLYQGTERGREHRRALEWFVKAAEQGHMEA